MSGVTDRGQKGTALAAESATAWEYDVVNEGDSAAIRWWTLASVGTPGT